MGGEAGFQLRFWLWSALMAVLCAVFAFAVLPRLRIDTDILALLPATERDAEAHEALDRYASSLSRRAVFLIGAPEFEFARSTAERFAADLRVSGAFSSISLEVAAQGGLPKALVDHRFGLVSTRTRARLGDQIERARMFDEALRAIYSPAGAPRPLPVVEDPLNLLGDFLLRALPEARLGSAQLREGVLTVSDGTLHYVLVGAEMDESPFSLSAQSRVMPIINAARDRARNTGGVEVLASGLVLHAAVATATAQREIGTVGTLSLVGITLMVLLCFRSPLPLLWSALVLGVGAVSAILACHFLFGRLHLVTLLFGTGLMGVAIDYSNHFLADQFRASPWSARRAYEHVGPGIAIGMACGVLGYLSLAITPLPGLRQMAVFCAVGLMVACASVLFWYPILARASRPGQRPWLLTASDRLDQALSRLGHRSRLAMGASLLILCITGLWHLDFSDDVRLLQPSPRALLSEDGKLRTLIGNLPDTRLFLVRAPTPEGVLAAESTLARELDQRIDAGALRAYSALSQALPTPDDQVATRDLLARTVYSKQGEAPRLLAQLGFDPATIASHLEEFARAPAEPLELEPWLSTPMAEPWRALWLGKIGNGYASVVGLTGVSGVETLRSIELPGVLWVDRVAETSALLERYRQRALGLIGGAYVLIGLLLARRYGVRPALRLLAVPAGAAIASLAIFGLLGLSANLFNVLALFLVLGLGVDYAVFLREGRDARAPTLLAITLSTLGTVLSYGLLAFSATPFIRSLGLTLLTGVALTWFLALLSERRAPS